MIRRRFDLLTTVLMATALATAACAGSDLSTDDGVGEDLDGDGKADSTVPNVPNANLNGIWDTKIGGAAAADIVISSWSEIGIELAIDGKPRKVTRSGNKLTGEGITLTVKPKGLGQMDDAIEGKIDGKTTKLVRDVEVKDELAIDLPGNKPYRKWLREDLTPAAQLDRESYVVMDAARILDWMDDTVLYKANSFQRKYMKGGTAAERNAHFKQMVEEFDGLVTTPRAVISDPRFTNAVKAHLKDTSLTGLALVNFNLYFTTAAGRALRMTFDDDAMAYFITDRPVRAEKLGLVVMDTPTHGPLASTFGRQLLDLADMPASDHALYVDAMMALLTKTDEEPTRRLSGMGKSALVDWFAVMAIEDYRGEAFANDSLAWGYNLTNIQFYGLVAKALARPGRMDANGKPIVGQVIVDGELRPGDASYADVLNGGNDMQEFPDIAELKGKATAWLRSAHPAVVAEVEAAFAGVVPVADLPSQTEGDIFHFICAQLYDSEDRSEGITATQARRINAAVAALFTALRDDSAAFEAYLLGNGLTASNQPAERATGF